MTLVLFVMCGTLFVLVVRAEKRLTQRIEGLQTALDRMQAEWDRGRRAPPPPASPEPAPGIKSEALEASAAKSETEDINAHE